MTLDDLKTIGILVVIWFVWLIRRSIKKERAAWAEATKYEPKNTRGDAGFATDKEIKDAGGFKKGEISVGFTLNTNREIFYNPNEGQLKPTMVFGSMGSWKTTSSQIPLALRWKGSLIMFEATGETAMTTAHYRQTFGPVQIINPMGAYRQYLKGLPEVGYNPLDPYWCNPNDPATFGTRMAKIAAGCAEESDSRNKFWDNSSRGLIKTIGMAEVALRPPGKATLGGIADIIHQDPKGYARWAVGRVRNPKLYTRLMRYARPGTDDFRSM
jgi:type IV secretory pathway TraG/TraD family ATPase VirD4